MEKNEFLDEVKRRGRMPSRGKAHTITSAVFDALRGMVEQDTSDRIYDETPEGLWPRRPEECVGQLIPTFESYDVYGFLSRVQKEAAIADVGEAERLTYAVLKTLHGTLSERTSEMIADDLPSDVRVMWIGATEAAPAEQTRPATASRETEKMTTKPEAGRPISEPGAYEQAPSDLLASEHQQVEMQLADEIQRLLNVSDEVDASNINVQVMHGEVILRGTVKSQRERDAAQRVVSEAIPSEEVRNEIRVEG